MPGKLSTDTLATALRELAEEGSTGALHLEGPEGTGRIFLRDGQVYWAVSPVARSQLGARLVGAGHLTEEELENALSGQERGPRRKLGALLVELELVPADVVRAVVTDMIMDAVVDILSWPSGTFEYFRGDAVAEDLPVQLPVTRVIAEGTRRLEEWRAIVARLGSVSTAPRIVHGAVRSADLAGDDFTVLRNIDGRRSVEQLASDLGYSLYEMARLVDRLVQQGAAEVGAGRTSGGDSAVSDLAEWLVEDEPADAGEPADDADISDDPAPDEPAAPVPGDQAAPVPGDQAAPVPGDDTPTSPPLPAEASDEPAPPTTTLSPLRTSDLDQALQEALAAAAPAPSLEDELPTVDVLVQPLVQEQAPPARASRRTKAAAAPTVEDPAPVEPTYVAPAVDLEPSVDEPEVWEAFLTSDTPGAHEGDPGAGAQAASAPTLTASRPAGQRARKQPARKRPAAQAAPPRAPAPASPAPPAPAPATEDISELLRELSRLSGEEPEPPKASEPPPPPAKPPPPDRPEPRTNPPAVPEERKGIRRIFGH